MAVGTHAGRYELEEQIGSGGMAAVYRGFDRRLERQVAVKILHEWLVTDADVVERFRREARAVAKLNHPNLVSVIDRGEVDGRPYIVLEYVEGESLKQMIREGQRLSVRRALELTIQAGRGLAFAHSQGVVHRDVKPENILVGRSGAKVTDFGIAHALGLDELTLVGSVLGTSSYVAPEQANGQVADARSDVYSLGVVLYELLTGDVPFHGASFVEVAMQHLTAPLPSVRDRCPAASPRLVAATERALAKDPGRRFPSMDAFVSELSLCLGEEATDEDTIAVASPLHVGPRILAGRRLRLRGARPLLLALAALAVIATVTVVVVDSTKSGGGLTPPSASGALNGPVHLRAVAPYDPPPGDGVENNAALGRATDGNPASFWSTEWYADPQFGHLKKGVGIVLDAAKPVRLRALTVASSTPGYTALIKAGASAKGPFSPVSTPLTAGSNATFSLRSTVPARYYLIWITELSPGTGPHYRVQINEVTARS